MLISDCPARPRLSLRRSTGPGSRISSTRRLRPLPWALHSRRLITLQQLPRRQLPLPCPNPPTSRPITTRPRITSSLGQLLLQTRHRRSPQTRSASSPPPPRRLNRHTSSRPPRRRTTHSLQRLRILRVPAFTPLPIITCRRSTVHFCRLASRTRSPLPTIRRPKTLSLRTGHSSIALRTAHLATLARAGTLRPAAVLPHLVIPTTNRWFSVRPNLSLPLARSQLSDRRLAMRR